MDNADELKIRLHKIFDESNLHFIFTNDEKLVSARLRYLARLTDCADRFDVLEKINKLNQSLNGPRFYMEEDNLALYVDQWNVGYLETFCGIITSVFVGMATINGDKIQELLEFDTNFEILYDENIKTHIQEMFGMLAVTSAKELQELE